MRSARVNGFVAVAVGLVAVAGVLGGGCARQPTWTLWKGSSDVRVDGTIDEEFYRPIPPVEFVVAGQPDKEPATTKAWLFMHKDSLIVAFKCVDPDIVAKEKSEDENEVDGQDRVELFLWSGKPGDTYYCLEIAPLGALHDYSSRFYRQFDSAWDMPGLTYKAGTNPMGYDVEAALPLAELERLGFSFRPGAEWRVGFFRADFHSAGGEPDWITWVDARTPQPDFHVAESFGRLKIGRDDR